MKYGKTHTFLAQYILELTLVDYRMLKYPPTHLASGAALLANKIMRISPPWPGTPGLAEHVCEKENKPRSIDPASFGYQKYPRNCFFLQSIILNSTRSHCSCRPSSEFHQVFAGNRPTKSKTLKIVVGLAAQLATWQLVWVFLCAGSFCGSEN